MDQVDREEPQRLEHYVEDLPRYQDADPRGPFWIPHRPARVIRRTGKPKGPSRQHHRDQREPDHAKRFAPDVSVGIKRDLTTVVRRRIATPYRRPGVGCLVQRGRK